MFRSKRGVILGALCLATVLVALGGAGTLSAGEPHRNWSKSGSFEALTDEPFVVDVIWSMRSPYCYIALDRILEIQQKYNVDFVFRPVWPIAIKDPEFFVGIADYMAYRGPYQGLDTVRSALYAGVSYLYPNPDPVDQAPNFGAVLPMEKQDKIKLLTYTAAGAQEMGKGWEYINEVAHMMWNGSIPKGWDQGTHVRDAIQRAGIDAGALIADVKANPDKYDKIVEANQAVQDAANFGGVPLFIFKNEVFFGQDRIDQLMWRMNQSGLKKRAEK